jgi:transcriptional regulator with XRE-family HTH domain
MAELPTFGTVITTARKAKEMSQKQLASMVVREDGETISPQYLNDIERDRRVPSSEVIVQLAVHLALKSDYLHALARKWPDDLAIEKAKPEKIQELMVAFRKSIRG